MKRNSLIMVVSIAFVMASCATADQKIPAIATDFCNCFNTMEKTMSPELKDIFVKAGESDSPQAELTKLLMAMDAEKQAAVTEELQAFSSLDDPNTEVGKCMNDFKKKYDDDKTRDKKKFYDKLLAEVKSKSGCTLGLAIMKIGYKELSE
jgi:Skp family chaperone for outer membrane proteins